MIEVRGLSKWFGPKRVLEGVDLDVDEGEVVVILGPSGSGKSTLLRCLNGLEWPEQGSVKLLGQDLRRTDLNQARAQAGMVFQQFNLFPHMTVLENLTLGPRVVLGLGREQAEQRLSLIHI